MLCTMNWLDFYVLEFWTYNVKGVIIVMYDVIGYVLIISYIVCWGMYSENTWILDGRVCLHFVQDEYLYLGNILNTKGTSPKFL